HRRAKGLRGGERLAPGAANRGAARLPPILRRAASGSPGQRIHPPGSAGWSSIPGDPFGAGAGEISGASEGESAAGGEPRLPPQRLRAGLVLCGAERSAGLRHGRHRGRHLRPEPRAPGAAAAAAAGAA
ncbi:unnamed protein product, partial [Effrenium voratum]